MQLFVPLHFSNRDTLIVAYYSSEILLVAQKFEKSFDIEVQKCMAGPGFGSSDGNQGIPYISCSYVGSFGLNLHMQMQESLGFFFMTPFQERLFIP